MREKRGGRQESGFVTLIIAAGLVLCGVLLLLIGRLGGAAADQAKARIAADSAALAGAAEGCESAGELARANGAVLVSCVGEAADVQVRVTVHEAEASARARREETVESIPPPVPPVLR